MSKVLIADDQALAVAGMRYLLESDNLFTVSGEVQSWPATLEFVQQKSPDVLILDYLNLSGYTPENLSQFCQQFPSIRICVISNDRDQKRILRTLRVNPTVFLTKDCSQEEIMTALRAAVNGQKFFCEEVLQLLMKQSNHSTEKNSENTLSPREIEIIRYISQELSTPTIADRLNLSPHTINAHRKRILKKLGVKSPVGLVMEAMRLQLIQV